MSENNQTRSSQNNTAETLSNDSDAASAASTVVNTGSYLYQIGGGNQILNNYNRVDYSYNIPYLHNILTKPVYKVYY